MSKMKQMNISYGLPKTLAYIFDWIFKKSGLPKLLKSYLAWIDRQIKKLIKSTKRALKDKKSID